MEQYMKQYQFAEVDEFVKIARQAWEYVVLKKTISLSELRKCYIALAQSNPDKVVTELRRNRFVSPSKGQKEMEQEYLEILKKLHGLQFMYYPDKKIVQYTTCSAFCCFTEKDREIVDDCEEKEVNYTTMHSDKPQKEILSISALADLLYSKLTDLQDSFLRLGFSLGNNSDSKEKQFQTDIARNNHQGGNEECSEGRFLNIYNEYQLVKVHQCLVESKFLEDNLDAWLYYWRAQNELSGRRNLVWLRTKASLAYFIDQMYSNCSIEEFPESITQKIFILKNNNEIKRCKDMRQSLNQVKNRKIESMDKRNKIYDKLDEIVNIVRKVP